MILKPYFDVSIEKWFLLVHKIPERYLKHHFQYHTEQKEMYALVVKRNFTFHKWKYHLVKG